MFISEYNTATDTFITFVPNTDTSALSLDYRDTDNARQFQIRQICTTKICTLIMYVSALISKQIRRSEKKKIF